MKYQFSVYPIIPLSMKYQFNVYPIIQLSMKYQFSVCIVKEIPIQCVTHTFVNEISIQCVPYHKDKPLMHYIYNFSDK